MHLVQGVRPSHLAFLFLHSTHAFGVTNPIPRRLLNALSSIAIFLTDTELSLVFRVIARQI